MPKKLFVFDIETIPDTDVVFNLTGSEETNVLKLRKELEDYHMEVADNPFPRQLFHRVVSISVLDADIIVDEKGFEYYKINKVGTISNTKYSEEEMTAKFFEYLCKHTPRIVDYNGRTFDLPVMKYRAMKYNLSIPELFNAGDKWNNYNTRFSFDWHCDLLDALSDCGASARCKMNEVCSILGIPGKIGVDGSKVSGMFDEGRLKEIDNYCETDVLNTYLIYLNYMLLIGKISKDGFYSMNKDLIDYMEKQDKEHFFEFLTMWEEVDTRNLFEK